MSTRLAWHHCRPEARDELIDTVGDTPPIVQPGAWKAHRHVSASDAPLVQAHGRGQRDLTGAAEQEALRRRRLQDQILALVW